MRSIIQVGILGLALFCAASAIASDDKPKQEKKKTRGEDNVIQNSPGASITNTTTMDGKTKTVRCDGSGKCTTTVR